MLILVFREISAPSRICIFSTLDRCLFDLHRYIYICCKQECTTYVCMERFQKYFSSSVPLSYIGAFGAFLGIKPELDLTFMSHIPNQTLFWPFTFTLGLKGMVKGIALDTYLVRYVAQ